METNFTPEEQLASTATVAENETPNTGNEVTVVDSSTEDEESQEDEAASDEGDEDIEDIEDLDEADADTEESGEEA